LVIIILEGVVNLFQLILHFLLFSTSRKQHFIQVDFETSFSSRPAFLLCAFHVPFSAPNWRLACERAFQKSHGPGCGDG